MHQSRGNRWMHVAALAFVIASVVCAVVYDEPVWYLGIPGSYFFAIVGHKVFEGNNPTFARVIREHGFSPRVLVYILLVEEACIIRLALEELGLAERRFYGRSAPDRESRS